METVELHEQCSVKKRSIKSLYSQLEYMVYVYIRVHLNTSEHILFVYYVCVYIYTLSFIFVLNTDALYIHAHF